MSGSENPKRYDLEDRTFEFARRTRAFVKQSPRSISNTEDLKQVVRATGSVGANFIEANEPLSKKDFVMRIKISRKEAKESRFFLRLLDVGEAAERARKREWLASEAQELTNIFGAILRKSS